MSPGYALRQSPGERYAQMSEGGEHRLPASRPNEIYYQYKNFENRDIRDTLEAHAGVCPLGLWYGCPEELKIRNQYCSQG